MKQFLLALFVLITFNSFAQTGQQLDYQWINSELKLLSASSGSGTDSLVVRNPSTGKFYQINRNSFLTNATGLITAGTNVTITGSGTAASPYVINSTGGGGGTDSAIWKNNGVYTANHALNLAGKKQFFINGQIKADTVRIGVVDTTTQDITIGGTSIEYGFYSTDTTGVYRYTTRLARILGLTEVNNAVAGQMASGYTLSNTPTYSTAHKYLLFSWGTNEILNNVDTTTTKTNFQSIITDALGKGWPAGKIIVLPNWYVTTTYNAFTTLAKQQAMLAMIRNLAAVNGCVFVDIWSTELANIINIPLYDGVHPTDVGHALAARKVLNTIGYVPRDNGQSLVVQGVTDLSKVRFGLQDTTVKAQVDPLGYDFNKQTMVQLVPNFYIQNTDSSQTPQAFTSANVSGNVKARTLIGSNMIIAGGNIGFAGAASPPAGINFGTGTSPNMGYISYYSATGTGGNLSIQSAGGSNLGVGVGTPTSKLHVFGTSTTTGEAVFSNGVVFNGGISGSSGLNIGLNGSGAARTVYINNYDASGRISINSNGGNVQIGSAVDIPSAVLNVVAANRGVLIPRLTQSQIGSISSPANGLIDYNRDSLKIQLYDSAAARWTYIPKVLINTATLDFGNTVAGAATDLTITVTGAQDGDPVAVGVVNASVPANGSFRAWVSSANTVTVRFVNNDLTTAYDPASGVFKVSVFK